MPVSGFSAPCSAEKLQNWYDGRQKCDTSAADFGVFEDGSTSFEPQTAHRSVLDRGVLLQVLREQTTNGSEHGPAGVNDLRLVVRSIPLAQLRQGLLLLLGRSGEHREQLL